MSTPDASHALHSVPEGIPDAPSYRLETLDDWIARGINSIQAIKEARGWRIASILLQAESVTAPLPKEYLP